MPASDGANGSYRSSRAVVMVLCLILASFLASLPVSVAQSSAQINQSWVNQQLAMWKPSHNSTMQFGVFFQPASYDNIRDSYNTPEVENASLNMLLSTGATCIRIDIGYDAWLKKETTTQSEIANLVSQIKAAGRCLIIADAGAESYRNAPLSWQQFKQAWVERVQTLASLFQPNYYIVIKEPGFYVPMVSDARTNPLFTSASDWLNLTESLVSTVHSASPNTLVGVSVSSDSLNQNPSYYDPYLVSLETLPGLSFLGFDIYTITAFNSTLQFINSHGSGNANVWIAECWSGTASAGIFDSSRSALDVSWMKLVYYFAQVIHADMVIPFFTPIFASYSINSATSSSQILSLLQQRTPVFYEFQSIVSSEGGSSVVQTSSNMVSSVSSATTSSVTSVLTSSSNTHRPKSFKPLLIAAAIIVVVVIVVSLVFLVYYFRKRDDKK